MQKPVLIGQTLGSKPEPQVQHYELIRKSEKISCCNGCNAQFDKNGANLHIMGKNEYDWLVFVDN